MREVESCEMVAGWSWPVWHEGEVDSGFLVSAQRHLPTQPLCRARGSAAGKLSNNSNGAAPADDSPIRFSPHTSTQARGCSSVANGRRRGADGFPGFAKPGGDAFDEAAMQATEPGAQARAMS